MIVRARMAVWRGIEGAAILFAKVFGTARMARETAALADRYYRRNDWQMAIFFGQVAIAADPSLVHSYALLGRVYYHTRHLILAEKIFRRLLKMDHDNQTALLHLAMIRKENGRYSEAEELLSRISDLDAFTDALSLMGEIKFRTGDMPNAVKFLELSISSGDVRARTYYNVALVYAAMNRTHEALAAARRAAMLDPQSEEYQALVEKLTRVVEINARISIVDD